MTTKPDPVDGLVITSAIVLPDEPVSVRRASWWRRLLARLFG